MRKFSAVAVIAAGSALLAAPGASSGVPGTFSYHEHGRAVARESSMLEAKAGTSIVVQTHVLEPGFRAPWHRHPGDSWVLMKRGVLTVYFSCAEKVVWEAGSAYHNPPSEKAVNEGEEPVELVVIYVNVPADHPAGVIPASPEAPPADCPL